MQGENWLAAGVTFTSFELLNTTALLVIQFGNSFQLDLLGTTTLTLPKGDPSPYVYAELELEVVLDPDDGVLKALAQLTPNSYVIDVRLPSDRRLCVLQLVLRRPRRRLRGDLRRLHFQLFAAATGTRSRATCRGSAYRGSPGGGVQVDGHARYFALTPSCVMAGEQMQATYSSGSLSAWFSAYTDFLINWHPFYYDARAGVSVGASITIHVIVSITFTVELSATLHAWGPPFAGEVEVDWTIISFTIPIGDTDSGNTAPDPLSWQDFSQYFLPGGGGNNSNSNSNAPSTAAPADSAPVSWVKVTALAGKLAPQSHTHPGSTWIIDPAKFVVKIDSVVPMTTIASTGVLGDQSFTGAGIGIFPMNQHEPDGDADARTRRPRETWTTRRGPSHRCCREPPARCGERPATGIRRPKVRRSNDYTIGRLPARRDRQHRRAADAERSAEPMQIDVLLTDKDTLPARTFDRHGAVGQSRRSRRHADGRRAVDDRKHGDDGVARRHPQ